MLSMKVEVFGCPSDGQWYKAHGWEQCFLILGAEMHAGAEVHPHPAPQQCKVMGERSQTGCWVLRPWGKALNPSCFASAKGWFAAGGLAVSCRHWSVALLVCLQLGSRIPLPGAKLCMVGTQSLHPQPEALPGFYNALKHRRLWRWTSKLEGLGKKIAATVISWLFKLKLNMLL